LKGVYILIIRLKKDRVIKVGNLGRIFFKEGIYFYVGRSLRGMEARIRRHLSKRKKLFWHIDYFLNSRDAKIIGIIKIKTQDKSLECQISRYFSKYFHPISYFGSSDCHCVSHFFFAG